MIIGSLLNDVRVERCRWMKGQERGVGSRSCYFRMMNFHCCYIMIIYVCHSVGTLSGLKLEIAACMQYRYGIQTAVF